MVESNCLAESCDRPAFARSLCHKHYKYQLRNKAPLPPKVQRQPRPKVPLFERLMQRINQSGPLPDNKPELGPCWLWEGCVASNGYGVINDGGTPAKRVSTHIVAYEAHKGPVAKGLEVDHLCFVRRCCNPAHLEAVTPRINNLRSNSISAQNARKTLCKRGHTLLPKPGSHKRFCPTCKSQKP